MPILGWMLVANMLIWNTNIEINPILNIHYGYWISNKYPSSDVDLVLLLGYVHKYQNRILKIQMIYEQYSYDMRQYFTS